MVEGVVGALIRVLHTSLLEPKTLTRDALFFPSLESKARLLRLLRSASYSCDVCIFTVTDEEIGDALLALHRRGLRVRIISDDEQAVRCVGSVIFTLAECVLPQNSNSRCSPCLSLICISGQGAHAAVHGAALGRSRDGRFGQGQPLAF